eukprot:1158022-Pelagomonas_calceolata.AAC.11
MGHCLFHWIIACSKDGSPPDRACLDKRMGHCLFACLPACLWSMHVCVASMSAACQPQKKGAGRCLIKCNFFAVFTAFECTVKLTDI